MPRCPHPGCATPDVPDPCDFDACPRSQELTEQQAYNLLSYAILSQGGGARRPTVTRATPTRLRFLIRDLERVEREYPPEEWARRIRKIAKAYRLTP